MEDASAEPASALRRIVELEAEVERLRGLLGLDQQVTDGHAIAVTPRLFDSDGDALPEVAEGSSNAEKLELMWALFGGRSDVYAKAWISQSSGKKGWSPEERGRWSKGKPPPKRDFLPLTDEVFARHLRGVDHVGIYPLSPGDTCRLLVCDFDDGSWALDALAYLQACHLHGVPAVLERSRSGDGAHVWLFFTAPVTATAARSLGTSLLRETMRARAELDLGSYDRFFPSQDYLQREGLGNLIALPLNGECRKRGTTLFLNPATMEPWPDQWAFLSSVGRLSPEDVELLAETLEPVEAGPTLTLEELVRSAGPPPPAQIRAELGTTLAIFRAGLPPAFVAALKHLASIHNPKFYENEQLRFSNWDTPRFIQAYREDLEWIYLPRGLIERTTEVVTAVGSKLEISDRRTTHDGCGFGFIGELRPEQIGPVADVLAHDHSVIDAPPGAGKTVMACAVIASYDRPTLVIVNRKHLVDQWRVRLTEYLGLSPAEIGQIGGGKTKPTGRIDVAMIQSLARRDDLPSLFEQYGMVVVDECHHVPAVSFERVVRNGTSRRWLGLTATPIRRDGLEALIAMHCGPTRHRIEVSEVSGDVMLSAEFVTHDTPLRFEINGVAVDGRDHIQEVYATLAQDEPRVVQVSADVHVALATGRTCLVLTGRVEHGDRIVQQLTELGHEPLVLHGGLGTKARKAVAAKLDAHQAGTGLVLVATGSLLGEGFDWPQLDTLFLAFPIAWKGNVTQYVGRLLRTHQGKNHVQLHDYVDAEIPVLRRMHNKRLPAIASLGFQVPKKRRLPTAQSASTRPPTSDSDDVGF